MILGQEKVEFPSGGAVTGAGTCVLLTSLLSLNIWGTRCTAMRGFARRLFFLSGVQSSEVVVLW